MSEKAEKNISGNGIRDTRQKFLELARQLPAEAQYAVGWIMENTDMVNRMVGPEPEDMDEYQKEIDKVRQGGDFLLWALLLYQKVVWEKEKSERRPL